MRKYTTLPYTELPVAEGNYGTDRLPIKYIVMHTMVGSWQSAAARFNTVGQQASSTYGVKLDGGIIAFLEEYFVPFTNGNYKSNQESITIEHEDGGDYNGPRTPQLYETSAKLVKDICKEYNIPIDRAHILKHSEVSLSPTACPDSLDIDRIIAMAKGESVPQQEETIAVRKSVFEKLVSNSSKYDEFVKAGYTESKQVTDKVSSLEARIKELEAANNSLSVSLRDEGFKLTQSEITRKSLEAMLNEVEKDNTSLAKENEKLSLLLSDCQKAKGLPEHSELDLFGIKIWILK